MLNILDTIQEWIMGILRECIMGNLDGMFDQINTEVGEVAANVGTTPARWNAGVFSIQTEADRLASELQNLAEPNTPDKTHFMAEVSLYFLPLASQDDMFRLFQKVQEQVKQPMYIAQVDGKKGQYFFMRREERTQEHKPSIKEQLTAKPVPGEQPIKPRTQEVR